VEQDIHAPALAREGGGGGGLASLCKWISTCMPPMQVNLHSEDKTALLDFRPEKTILVIVTSNISMYHNRSISFCFNLYEGGRGNYMYIYMYISVYPPPRCPGLF
jgi:hypothetical protein